MKIADVFRVWDRQSQEMVHFTLYQLLPEYCDEGNYHSISKSALFQIRQDIDVDTVMKFTGLHDKNGRDVYESDIVKADLRRSYVMPNNDNPQIYEVEYDERAQIIPFHVIVGYDGELWTDALVDGFTVIGNIYTNPELVKS
jgi:uncharacterized phage protein (TIGR01671 family)